MFGTKEFNWPSPMHFDMALQEPVFYMMHRGIRVDSHKKKDFSEEYHKRWDGLQTKLNAVAGHDLNVSSAPQMRSWLYKELNLPERRYNGKVTTREEALRSLLSLCGDKVNSLKTERARHRWMRGYISIMLTLKIRALRKRIESYIDINMDTDERMRTTLSVGGTETGRFSSSKTLWDTGCNLQTIPHELRSMFIADEGMELAEIDLNRGESWIYSHLAEEPTMMEIHRDGRDFHSETAAALSKLFGDEKSVEWIATNKNDNDFAYKLRYLGKRYNHASAYQMTPYRAAEVINKEAEDTGITVTVADSKRAMKIWKQLYPFIKSWWDSIERDLNNNARTLETPLGRKRTFYESWGNNLFKEATAYKPQSTSVDYLDIGLLRVYHELQQPGWRGVELLHQNHDSILIQYPIEHRDDVLPAVKQLLETKININGYELVIPTEPAYGQSWGSLTEWKEAA